MFNHGILTGALFLLVGFLYERTHTRQIADMGMLAKPLPVLAGFFLFFALGSLGLPGLNGFVGEFLSLLGLFQYSHWLAADRRHRRHPGRLLPALDVPARDVQRPRRRGRRRRASACVTSALREIASLLPLVVFAVWVGRLPEHLPRLPARAGAGDPRPGDAVARASAHARRPRPAGRLHEGAVLMAANNTDRRHPAGARGRGRGARRVRSSTCSCRARRVLAWIAAGGLVAGRRRGRRSVAHAPSGGLAPRPPRGREVGLRRHGRARQVRPLLRSCCSPPSACSPSCSPTPTWSAATRRAASSTGCCCSSSPA